ncbi:MAG: flagellar biosynthesis anti-sigma factor FlgM [Gammaproteobacteria bacterium HGW-Gammaproteobacteria-3]|jgi:negative regulator of flagellin synthesis FlgM|nr:MAG: flagellar biosynthesis anti-sigma factor FlgM [Gammaproteobacteria bacterium HGW-Gammaproteobacteria-3]
MAIDPISSRLQSATISKTGTKTNSETGPAQSTNKTHGDNIEITANSAKINKALESARSEPIVDNDRVAVIKQALSDGTYTIDANKIAQKLTQFDSLLNQNSS